MKLLQTASKSLPAYFYLYFQIIKCHKKYEQNLQVVTECLVDISAFLIFSVDKNLQGKSTVYPPGAWSAHLYFITTFMLKSYQFCSGDRIYASFPNCCLECFQRDIERPMEYLLKE